MHSSGNPRERDIVNGLTTVSIAVSALLRHCRVLPQIVKPPDTIGRTTLESMKVYRVWNYFCVDWYLE